MIGRKQCHAELFSYIIGILSFSLTKSHYQDNFNAALGAKKNDTVRRKLLHVTEAAGNKRLVAGLQGDLLTLQAHLSSLIETETGVSDDDEIQMEYVAPHLDDEVI